MRFRDLCPRVSQSRLTDSLRKEGADAIDWAFRVIGENLKPDRAQKETDWGRCCHMEMYAAVPYAEGGFEGGRR